jgi:hypothetical protein
LHIILLCNLPMIETNGLGRGPQYSLQVNQEEKT